MDYYKTLGIDRNASAEDIKKAYRRLASKNHPDKGGSTEEFQRLQAAYDALSDPVKRQQHDNPQPQGSPAGFHFNFGGGAGGLNDIFNEMFRHAQGHPGRPQQQMYRTTIFITLEQVFTGGEQPLRFQTNTTSHTISITIPKGIQDGAQMRCENVLDGAGLIVEFRIHPHLKFDRRGQDLVCICPVSVLDLVTGTKFEFLSMSGATLEVTIPPMTQPHMQLKIGGQGLPIPNTNQYGDQIIVIKPVLPPVIHPEVIDVLMRHA
jgi:curved DNA-binding protein